MRVLFLHGLESDPHGAKFTALDKIHETVAPDMRGLGLVERVALAKVTIEAEMPDIVVGSSYGGLTAVLATMAAEFKPKGIVLLAPSLKRAEAPSIGSLRAVASTIVIHDKEDDVVPFEAGSEYAANTGSKLVMAHGGHRLRDPESLGLLMEAVLELA